MRQECNHETVYKTSALLLRAVETFRVRRAQGDTTRRGGLQTVSCNGKHEGI